MISTKNVPSGSSTMTETKREIAVKGPKGLFEVTHTSQETIADLKAKIEELYGHPRSSQSFWFRNPEDQREEIGNTRQLAELGNRLGRLHLEVNADAQNPDTQKATESGAGAGSANDENSITNGNNRIGQVDAEDEARASAGNYHSEEAIKNGSRDMKGANNSVGGARLKGKANVFVGDVFGGPSPFSR